MSRNELVDPLSAWPSRGGRRRAAWVGEHVSASSTASRARRSTSSGRARVDRPRPCSSPALNDHIPPRASSMKRSRTRLLRSRRTEASGLDHGPISIHDRMKAMGLEAPSIAALARIFRERGVARLEPRKRPRVSWRRFVDPAPNALAAGCDPRRPHQRPDLRDLPAPGRSFAPRGRLSRGGQRYS